MDRVGSSLQSIVGERRIYSDRSHTHEHPFAQLILPLKGTLFIETPDCPVSVNESRIFFLPPHCAHTFFANAANEFLVLDIPTGLVAGERPLAAAGVMTDLDDRWQALRTLLLAELHQGPSADFVPLFHYAYRLLQREQIPRSMHYIQANLHQPIDLKRLAALEGYQVTYYCEWFKQQTGMTPNAYIQQLRMQKAKELLEQTDLSIWQIAQQVGYVHPASLTRLFQQHEQITPIAYRHRVRLAID